MSDNPNEAKQPKVENEIPICADGWLAVFDLIAPHQLGLEIALLSHRLDYYVDEHFKTRKWTLGEMTICHKIGGNGAKEMQIFKYNWKPLPIPRVPVPKKVVGFKHILIRSINQNVVDFLRLVRHTFASSVASFEIISANNGALELIMHNIWPLIKDNISVIALTARIDLHQMRQFVPSILSDCPSLCTLYTLYDVFPVFPSDGNVNASDGQLVAKWLFSPPLLLDGVPKVLHCRLYSVEQWPSKVEGIKAAFVTASSSANFIIVIWGLFVFDIYVPLLELTNELTGERFTLKRTNDNVRCLLIRCPISRDEQKWAKWEEEARQWRFDCKEKSRIVIRGDSD